MGGNSKGWGRRGTHRAGAALVRTDLPLQWDLGRPGKREREGEDTPCVSESESAGFRDCTYFRENPTCLYRGDCPCASLGGSASLCTHVWAY